MPNVQTNTVKWYKLVYGLLVFLMLLALVIFGIVTWNTVKSQANNSLIPHNIGLSSAISEFLSRQKSVLDSVASSLSYDAGQQRLEDILKATPQMRVMAVLDENYQPKVTTGDLKADEWKPLFVNDKMIGLPFRPSFIGESVLPIKSTVYDSQGKVTGYVVAAYRLLDNSEMWQVSDEDGLQRRSLIVGPDGRVYAAYPESANFWEGYIDTYVDPEFVSALKSTDTLSQETILNPTSVTFQNEEVDIASRYLPEYQLYIVSGVDMSEIKARWFERMQYVAMAVLIFIVAGFFIFRVVLKRAALSETEKDTAERNVLKLSQAMEQSPSSVVVTDANWMVEYDNKRQTDKQGVGSRLEVGKALLDVYPYRLLNRDLESIKHSLDHGDSWYGERLAKELKQWFSFSVSGITDNDGLLTNYAIVAQDISERKRTEVRLYKQANFDALTGLPNRRRTNDLLEDQLKEAWKNEEKVAVLYMDVDNFKQVNDTFGHMLGDQMLQMVAMRLQKAVMSRATACHMSGDEFLIYIRFTDESDVKEQAERIMEILKEPVKLEGKRLFVSVSIGISRYPEDSGDVGGLLKYADIALYESKNLGRRCYSFFNTELDERNKRKVELESEVRQALVNEELFMAYQTKNRISNREVYGFEALMRWNSPKLGFVSPEEFITAAEEIGVIDSLGEFALYQACEDLKKFQEDADHPLTMAVNVSMKQLTHSDLIQTVQNVLEETGVNPKCLELEITESMLAQRLDEVQPVLNGLLELGVSLSIDDFGTGYSSLSYLTRFPVSTLKIDRCFVMDMVENKSDATLTHTVITMAHKLGLKVVAEGIEDEDQLALLRVYDCDIGQGYFFTKPLNCEQMQSHLRSLKEKPDWAI
ncbi:EAL domain-containing protein [Neptunomonas phycophila]|uniref:EAL domain-containing protein n=2 Tax=Neptunomonas phycophila TaxID=1572645 RepID=A0AAW7XNQ7_9GAMM|nr:EAL domain-containing protein [Neptunomonas phycophila]MDO6455386.1 EAL domain-containing protein [Neptunomonas phycophila]